MSEPTGPAVLPLNKNATPIAYVTERPRWNKLNRTFYIGAGLVLLVLFIAWVGPLLYGRDPLLQNLGRALESPSGDHWLGTDQFGRDMLARILYGLRVDLQIGVFATLYTMVFGVIVGSLAGYYGGITDTLLMRLLDIMIAFPELILVIAVIAMLGQGIINMYIAIGLVGWISYARLTRGEVLVDKELDYTTAARTIGCRDRRIILNHLLPNIVTPAIVFGMSDIILNILFAASLGFLGLGVQPPAAELGTMVADGRAMLLTQPNLTTYPGLAIVAVGIAFSVLGDGLADYLRPSK